MMNKNFIKFELVDNTNLDNYNESCKMEKSWFGKESDGQVMGIETYYNYCKEFAAALGFCEKTIEEWFGNY